MRKNFIKLLFGVVFLLPSFALAQVANPPQTGPGGSTPAGGTTGQVQINNNGGFAGATAAQLDAAVGTFSSTLPGIVPQSGGGTANFLRADGTWATPVVPTAGSLVSASTTTPVSAATDTAIPTGYIHFLRTISPTGTIASLTEPLPASPFNGQQVEYYITQQVTALTFTGGTLAIWTPGGTAYQGVHITATYSSADNAWE